MMTSYKVVYASAAEFAALRMWEIVKCKYKMKMSNVECCECKVSLFKV